MNGVALGWYLQWWSWYHHTVVSYLPNDMLFFNLYYRRWKRFWKWLAQGHMAYGWDQNSNTFKVQNMRNYYSQVKSSCPTAEYGMTRLMVKASRLFCFSINKQAFYSILSHPLSVLLPVAQPMQLQRHFYLRNMYQGSILANFHNFYN